MIWLLGACLVDGALYRQRLAELTDNDGDHWTEDAGDCNDAAPDVHPKAAEICNDIDDDCDGSVDEDLPMWFLDYDEDGYGDAATSVETCDPPAGFVETDDDCDDDDPHVHPGATETCNGTDDDCDELVDGHDGDLEGGIPVYTDGDDDGYGDDATQQSGCAGEKGLVEIGGDCDDTTQAVHPGAEPEICEDGIDTNCDGSGLGCTGSASTADALLYGEGEGDEAGYQTASGVDINGDGFTDLVIGARANDAAGSDAGAAYIMLGPILTGDQSLSTAWTTLTGATGDKAGRAVALVGDVGADGVQDIAVAAPLNDSTDIDTGAVYFMSASDLRSGLSTLESAAWAEIDGAHRDDYCGTAITGAGDVNGDLDQDVWIGASGDSSGGEHAGSVFLILGPVTPRVRTLDAERTAEVIGGAYESSNLGTVIAAGDFDGDGLADAGLGDRYYNTYGYQSGGVFVFLGPLSGDLPIEAADATVLAEKIGDALGASASSVGDFDGDGRDDLLVGAPTAASGGAAYAILGTSSISALSAPAPDIASATIQSGDVNVREVGSSVAMGGDLDQDGISDVLVGAAGSSALAQGAAFAVAGPISGTVALDHAGGAVLLRVDGDLANDRLGSNVAFTGAIASGAAEGAMITSSTLTARGTSTTGGSYLFWDVAP